MRSLVCALCVWTLVGCRNQSTSLSNPFLAPDRVPPPATRVLTPGTAQPYYQGNPSQPAPNYYAPPTTTPQTPAYNSAPVTPAVPSLPPTGWNAYPHPSSAPGLSPASANRATDYGVSPASAVTIPGDDNQLRFAQAFAPAESPWVQPAAPLAAAPSAAAQPGGLPQSPSPPLPIQSNVPAEHEFQQHKFHQTSQSGASPPFNQYGADEISANQYSAIPQQLRTRELTPAELQYTPGSTRPEPAVASRWADAFRPQGSSRRPTNSPFSRPTISSRSQDVSSLARYGFGPRYEWLRGRLEYSQVTSQWKLRYIPIQPGVASSFNADQFGGSVLIDNAHLLGDLRPGDFVSVRGQLHTRDSDPQSFAPVYTVSVVQRQQVRM